MLKFAYRPSPDNNLRGHHILLKNRLARMLCLQLCERLGPKPNRADDRDKPGGSTPQIATQPVETDTENGSAPV